MLGPIEKGAGDGQIQYIKDIVAALRAAVAAKAAPVGRVTGKKGKSRRRDKEASEQAAAVATLAEAKTEAQSDWGLFEPVRLIFEPIGQIFGPMISPQVIIGILMLLLAYSWLWPSRSSNSLGFPITTPDRLAAYEEIWRREESELWDWLEDRVGLHDGVPMARYGDPEKAERQKVLARKVMSKKLAGSERMREGQVEDAIRITEEKLGALKDAVKRKKGE